VTRASMMPITESLSINDGTVEVRSAYTVSASESLSLDDGTVTHQLAAIKSISEPIALSDITLTQSSRTSSLVESIPLNETIVPQKSAAAYLSESVNITDSNTRQMNAFATLIEPMTVSDTVSRSKQSISSLSESLDVVEGIAHARNLASDQRLVMPFEPTINLVPSQPRLVVSSPSVQLSTVNIPFAVKSSSSDYSMIMTQTALKSTVHISNGLTINKDTNGDGSTELQVMIQPDTDLSGPASWNALFNLPTILSNPLVLPVTPGKVSTIVTQFEAGNGSTTIESSKPSKITFFGESGNSVGFTYGNVVREITLSCVNNAIPVGANECKELQGRNLVVWTNHFSEFVTWSLHAPPAPPAPPALSSGGGYATGVTISGAIGAAGLGGTITPDLTLYQVSYDVCNQYKTEIVVGSKSEILPDVILRTPVGIVDATISPMQPYASLLNLTRQHITVYEAPLRPQFKSFNLLIKEANGTDYITSRVDITKCERTVSYAEIPEVGKYSPMAPKIFDVKFQVGNQSKILAANATTQYVSNETLSASSIIYSPTPIDRAEIRFVQAGQNETGYIAAKMNVTGTNMSNTYVISGTIPRDQMTEPGITYWVWVRNTDQITAESSRYSIGVMPPFAINGTVGFEMNQNIAEGSVQSPTIYVQNNANGTIFGTVSLVVNGTVVSSYANQLFENGTSVLQLEWTVPKIFNATSYPVQVEAQFYNTTFASKQVNINTYPITVSIPLSNLTSVQDFVGIDGNTTARPYIMYSSFYNTGNLTFKVVSPSGTCLIGSAYCIVGNSTVKQGERFVTVNVNNHAYNIQYSGTGAVIQRFTITSSEPIVGPWKVTIQKGGIEQIDLEEKTLLKVKYLREAVPLVSVLP